MFIDSEMAHLVHTFLSKNRLLVNIHIFDYHPDLNDLELFDL